MLMQTRLRTAAFAVACLLWFSPTFVAAQKPQGKATKKPTLQYTGIASWYGIQHQGRKMANGQAFDRTKLTAASWYFPLGTQLRVVNVDNGKAVKVTVTDRGPDVSLHRAIDLSEAAARELDYLSRGLAQVLLFPIFPAQTEPARLNDRLIAPLPVPVRPQPIMSAELSTEMVLP
jgi:rare lipoprotein A